MRRRAFVRAAVGAAAGVLGLSGCAGAPSEPAASANYVPDEPNYRGWFDGVSNYTATVDARGEKTVRIDVGTKNRNGYYAFDPPAVAVSPQTRVRWEWTGRGGQHNVVAERGSFDSGRPVETAGHEFAHTFERPAIYKYACEPHEALGMRGAVFVALGDSNE